MASSTPISRSRTSFFISVPLPLRPHRPMPARRCIRYQPIIQATTSSHVGMDGCAPRRVTASPRGERRLHHAFEDELAGGARGGEHAQVGVTRARGVHRLAALRGHAHELAVDTCDDHDPADPSVITPMPPSVSSSSLSSAAVQEVSSAGAIPVMAAHSVSFRHTRSTSRHASSGSSQAGAGLKMVKSPWRCARTIAAAVVARSHSPWAMKTLPMGAAARSHQLIDRALDILGRAHRVRAPPRARCGLSPPLRRMVAVPVGTSARRATFAQSTPASSRPAVSSRPKPSSPTAAIM